MRLTNRQLLNLNSASELSTAESNAGVSRHLDRENISSDNGVNIATVLNLAVSAIINELAGWLMGFLLRCCVPIRVSYVF